MEARWGPEGPSRPGSGAGMAPWGWAPMWCPCGVQLLARVRVSFCPGPSPVPKNSKSVFVYQQQADFPALWPLAGPTK
jgi:hypothetical protein